MLSAILCWATRLKQSLSFRGSRKPSTWDFDLWMWCSGWVRKACLKTTGGTGWGQIKQPKSEFAFSGSLWGWSSTDWSIITRWNVPKGSGRHVIQILYAINVFDYTWKSPGAEIYVRGWNQFEGLKLELKTQGSKKRQGRKIEVYIYYLYICIYIYLKNNIIYILIDCIYKYYVCMYVNM